jgi:hypothetical protein
MHTLGGLRQAVDVELVAKVFVLDTVQAANLVLVLVLNNLSFAGRSKPFDSIPFAGALGSKGFFRC